MKTKFLTWGSAIICCALAFTTVSCSDDDDAKEFKIEESIVSGITASQDGAVVEFPVASDGEWSASVPADCDWVDVMVDTGKDGEKLALAIDQTPGIARNTTLTVKNGSKSISIPIKQETSRDNADNEYLLYSTKGLGCGYNPKTSSTMTQNVLNFAVIDKLAAQNPDDFSQATSFGPVAEMKADILTFDSIQDKSDSIGAKLSLSVSYSKFKFGLSGQITSEEIVKTDNQKRLYAANYPRYEGTVQYSDLATAYRMWVEEGRPKKTEDNETDYRASVLSLGFRMALTKLEDEVAKNPVNSYKESGTIQKACKNIVSTYGPLVITDVILGGSYLLEFQLDSAYSKEVFWLDDAKVTTNFTTGLFALDLNVQVDYENDVKDFLKHCNYGVLLIGGTFEKQNAVYDYFTGKDYDFKDKSILKDWANSLKLDKDKSKTTVELVRCDVVPIWTFFNDETADLLREYVLDQEDYKDIELMEKVDIVTTKKK